MNNGIEVYGRDECADTKATLKHLDRLGAEYRYVDITDDPAAARRLKEWNAGEAMTPTVLLHGTVAGEDQDRMLSAPSDTQLDMTLDELGLLPLKDEGDGSPGLSRGSPS